MRRIRKFVLMLAVLFFCSACFFGGKRASTPPPASDDQPASEFDWLGKGSELSIPIDTGLDQLSNYCQSAKVEYSGKDQKGAIISASQEYRVEFDRKGVYTQREVETDITPDRYMTGTQEAIFSANAIYTFRSSDLAGNICSIEPAPPPGVKSSFHTAAISSITPGKLLEKNVQVNGRSADVYEIKALGILFKSEVQSIQGRVWIARGQRFFIKAEGSFEGSITFDTIITNGSATFQYEVGDFDQVKILPPPVCSTP